ncbi:MAG: Holliday junction branch migration DNA helicase RuvB [Candidatus Gracilibacteria bacterium]|nr:Holliday junction branch migration DNA helicase RuvB [Candidatus Gracilibacteria bacterium]
MIEKDSNRLISSKLKNESEASDENSLRPRKIEEFIGQTKNKDNLKIFIEAARKRKEPLEHILLYGPPGLGKTTLSCIIANEMGVSIRTTSGPAIERAGDLASLLTNLKPNDVLFIDEIHRLKSTVEEVLYSAMEDFKLDIILGKGPSARSMRLSIAPFTLIGATTKVGNVSSPLRDRFGSVTRLDFYTIDEIAAIIERSAKILKVQIDAGGLRELASRARFTPRIANRLLKRVRDFAEVSFDGVITEEVAKEALSKMHVDEKGLDKTDYELLKLLIEKFEGGPVGLSTLAAALSEETQTIEDVYEPFLIQQGLLTRTARGRVATRAAYEHLGVPWSEERQGSLL